MVQAEKPRSPLKIYVDILTTVRNQGKAKPTRILYLANLSHDRLVRYLSELVSKGLLDEKVDEENRYYTLTRKGTDFLTEVKKAEAFVSGFGIAI